jgi:hypothetical protein
MAKHLAENLPEKGQLIFFCDCPLPRFFCHAPPEDLQGFDRKNKICK